MMGISEFFQGFRLVMQPGLRRYVLVPLLINLALMGGFIVWCYGYFTGWTATLLSYLPSWLEWLSWLLVPVMVLMLLAVLVYVFNMLANLIAAPFNSLLAEQVEKRLRGVETINQESLMAMVTRTLVREFSKLAYYLPRLLALIVISFIPGLNIISPLLWFVFGAWMMSVQYTDYVADNNQKEFSELRRVLRQKPLKALGFGSLVTFCLMVPVLNFMIIPAAVAGATAMWVKSNPVNSLLNEA